jgi:mannose-6-phosphate isomerase-like protein (cupin superfamily)
LSRRAFFIAGDRIIHIANPCGAGLSYHAQAHVVMPGAQVGPQMQEQAETVILVEEGILEVMINGMSGLVSAGNFIRVPAKAWYAYRNDTDDAARVLCRTAPVQKTREGCRITIQIAAA